MDAPGQTRYWIGQTDGNVADALARLRSVIPDSRAIVRGVDSIRSPDDIAGILARFDSEGGSTGPKTVVSVPALYAALDGGMFCGFDEIWLTTDRTATHVAVSDDIVLTSEAVQFGTEEERGILSLMDEHRVFLILADGCGLNYATTMSEIAEILSRA